MLKFQLPNLLEPFAWGTFGFKDMQQWPSLPLGTMMAGDPILDSDWARRQRIMFLCQITEPLDLEDLLVRAKEELFRADEENCDIDPLVDDLDIDVDLVLNLLLIPEEKWSRNEKRRMRNFVERRLRLLR